MLSVINIYPYGEYKYEFISDDKILKQKNILLNPNAEAYKIKSIISGHGHAGPRNCCEWDSKTHTYYLNNWRIFRWNIWKDCGNNPIYPQGGTWPFDRAGWCPGTKVDEYEFELTPHVIPGESILIDYGIEPYQNNGEKEGYFRMTHQLFSYEEPNFNHDAEIVDIITPSSKNKYNRINPWDSRILDKILDKDYLLSNLYINGKLLSEIKNYKVKKNYLKNHHFSLHPKLPPKLKYLCL